MPKPAATIQEPSLGSYFFTVTLSPKLYKYSITTQYELTQCKMIDVLEVHAHTYNFVPEITSTGNIHYHGWVSLTSAFHRFKILDKFKNKQMFGFIKLTPECILTKESAVRVCNYMNKEIEQTKKLIATKHSYIDISSRDIRAIPTCFTYDPNNEIELNCLDKNPLE